jgi:hypothetical protein
MTVAASSCHDCSPCRLWWNEEWGSAEGWYNFFLGGNGPPGNNFFFLLVQKKIPNTDT